MELNSLRAWIYDRFAPVVLVAGTPAAEAICQSANGLSLVDILRPPGQTVAPLNGGADVSPPVARLPRCCLEVPLGLCCML